MSKSDNVYEFINDRFPVTSVLKQYGVLVRNRTFKCPIHGDKTSSGSIYDKNGREQWRCHTCDKGGDSLDLVQAIEGCDRREALRKLTGQDPSFRPPPEPPQPRQKPETKLLFDLVPIPAAELAKIRPGAATPEVLHQNGKAFAYRPQMVHVYQDEHGAVPMVVIRYLRSGDAAKKIFSPLRWCQRRSTLVAAGWREQEPRLLYRQPELALHPDKPVLVVEGEKCADLLGQLPAFDDHVVVSWSGGTNQVAQQPWKLLQGRRVVLWPDADMPGDGRAEGKGQVAMLKIAAACQPAQVEIVEPLQEWIDRDTGFDAYDLIETLEGDAVGAREQMRSLTVGWRPPGPPSPPSGPGGGGGSGGPPGGGQSQWILNKDGGLAQTQHLNVRKVVIDFYADRLTYDVMDRLTLFDGEPLDRRQLGAVGMEVSLRYGMRNVNLDVLGEYMAIEAKLRSVNRLADQLRALKWDGRSRSLADYCGIARPRADASEAETESYAWAWQACWRWLLGLVRRVLEPGCKHDGVLVLEGRQGLRKSSFFEVMGTPFGQPRYLELAKLTQERDVQAKLGGTVVVELAELAAHRLGEVDAVKAMISSRSDTYRELYERDPVKHPRTCVFGGSTNESKYLRDPTGNRRYWIVPVTEHADIDGLKDKLPQILAEAVDAIEHGPISHSQNWLNEAEETAQMAEAAKREIDYPQLANLDDVLEAVDGEITKRDLWNGLGFTHAGARTPLLGQQLEKMMLERGWVHGRHNRNLTNRRSWKLQAQPDTVGS